MIKTTIYTIDTHTEGDITRFVVGGIPYIKGNDMVEKQEYFKNNMDYIRKTVLQEPRGHKDMFGAVFTSPVSEDSDYGLLFIDNEGHLSLCGHAIMASVIVSKTLGIIKEEQDLVKVDTVAGKVEAKYLKNLHNTVKVISSPSFCFALNKSGAASGWHAMVNAGTTSRQLSNEKHAYPIAYGGMQMETIMALLSSTLVVTMFTFADYKELTLNPGGTFANALGNAITHLGLPATFGSTLGALALSALTLTTMDSYARNSRYMVQEIGKNTIFSNKIVSTATVIVAGSVLLFWVPFMQLWTGMVLIALVGLVGPLVVIWTERSSRKIPWDGPFIRHVILSLAFIYPTAYCALLYMLYNSFKSKNIIVSLMTLYLIVAASVFLIEAYKKVKSVSSSPSPSQTLDN